MSISSGKAAQALGLLGAPQHFYLSFADSRFLGGAVVEAMNMLHAVTVSHQLGINPGGEVAILPLGLRITDQEWLDMWANRLLNETEARDLPMPWKEGQV